MDEPYGSVAARFWLSMQMSQHRRKVYEQRREARREKWLITTLTIVIVLCSTVVWR